MNPPLILVSWMPLDTSSLSVPRLHTCEMERRSAPQGRYERDMGWRPWNSFWGSWGPHASVDTTGSPRSRAGMLPLPLGSVELRAWGGASLPHSGACTLCGRQALRAFAQLLTGLSLGKDRVSYITFCPGWGQAGPPWVFTGYLLCARPRGGRQAGDQWDSAPPTRAAEKPLWLLLLPTVYTACHGAMLRTLPVRDLLEASQLLFHRRKNRPRQIK